MKCRELCLQSQPQGQLRPSDFKLIERTLPSVKNGEVLVENLYLSVDPYMRGRLSTAPLGEALTGDSIGRVLESRDNTFRKGDLVQSLFGLRDRYVASSSDLRALHRDPGLPLTVYMHALGMTGFTAYGGLLHIGGLKSGETVFVSAAAGAVGSIVVQLAKLKGATVIASAGRRDKVEWLRLLGADHVINYHETPIAAALAQIDKRIDVYFDNVGGDHLDAALIRMNPLGRIAVCGMISGYDGAPQAVRNLPAIIYGRVNIRGFIAADFWSHHETFQREMAAWLKHGQVKYKETIYDGLENAAVALVDLFRGENTGKMLVRLKKE